MCSYLIACVLPSPSLSVTSLDRLGGRQRLQLCVYTDGVAVEAVAVGGGGKRGAISGQAGRPPPPHPCPALSDPAPAPARSQLDGAAALGQTLADDVGRRESEVLCDGHVCVRMGYISAAWPAAAPAGSSLGETLESRRRDARLARRRTQDRGGYSRPVPLGCPTAGSPAARRQADELMALSGEKWQPPSRP